LRHLDLGSRSTEAFFFTTFTAQDVRSSSGSDGRKSMAELADPCPTSRPPDMLIDCTYSQIGGVCEILHRGQHINTVDKDDILPISSINTRLVTSYGDVKSHFRPHLGIDTYFRIMPTMRSIIATPSFAEGFMKLFRCIMDEAGLIR
jgi:hypothetical protein